MTKNMTVRLYYEDAYLKEFDARVTGCEEKNGSYLVSLNRCAFYPEGGGQSGDRGFLVRDDQTRVMVNDTCEKDGSIYVVCGESFNPGEMVHGVLDWEFRFDRMQNHSGEHIVSGLIHDTYGYNNVGFHMSADRMTIDLDGEISEDGLREIEKRANEIVWADAVVRTGVYSHEEAEDIEYRSKKELQGEIRIVTIEGADVCACCGTHVKRTGEIGLIKLLSHERFRGGVRIEMMCGRWAYEYLNSIYIQNHEVSVHLSSRMLQTGAAALRMMEENTNLKGRLIGAMYAAMDQKADELKDAGDVLIFAGQYDASSAQKLCAKVMETCGGCVCVFAGSDDDGYKYAAGCKDGDIRDLIRRMNSDLQGRGGGRPYFQQGSVNSARSDIEKFWLGCCPGIRISEMQSWQ